ncbi:phosphatase PAP2 family protein [Gemella morbillorum]
MEKKKYNLIMIVSIFTFLIIAIGYDSFLKNLDLMIINFIQGFEVRGLTIFYMSITDVADTWQSTILVVVITVILYLIKYKREALFLVLTMSTCGIIMSFIKNIFVRQRPETHRLIEVSGLSFPSGHSTSATIMYLTLGLIAINVLQKTSKYIILFISMLGILIITTSRIYLGVHYPTDTMAAVCLGVFVVTFYYKSYYKRVKIKD